MENGRAIRSVTEYNEKTTKKSPPGMPHTPGGQEGCVQCRAIPSNSQKQSEQDMGRFENTTKPHTEQSTKGRSLTGTRGLSRNFNKTG